MPFITQALEPQSFGSPRRVEPAFEQTASRGWTIQVITADTENETSATRGTSAIGEADLAENQIQHQLEHEDHQST